MSMEKLFMTLKNTKIFKKLNKSFNELKKGLKFKKFRGNIESVDYEDLDNYDYNHDFADDDEYKKLGVLEHYLKSLTEIITNQ